MKNSKKIINDLITKYDLDSVIKYDETRDIIQSIIKSKTNEEDLLDFIHFYIGKDDKLMDSLIKLNYKKLLEKIKNYKSYYYVKFIYDYEVDFNSRDKKVKFIEFIKNEILSGMSQDTNFESFNIKLIEELVEERYQGFLDKRMIELNKIKDKLYRFKLELSDSDFDKQYNDLLKDIENEYTKKYEPTEGYGYDLTLIEGLTKECKKQYKENNINIFDNINIDNEINETLDKTKNFIYTTKNIAYGAYDKERIYDSEFIRQDSEQIYKFFSRNLAYLKKGEVLNKEQIFNYLTKISNELKNKTIKKEKTVLTRLDTFPYQESAKEILITKGMTELSASNRVASTSRRKIEELVRIKNDLKDITLILSKKLNLSRDEKDGFNFHIFGTMIDKKLLLNIGAKKAFTKENMSDFIIDVILEKDNTELDLDKMKYYLCLIKPIISSMGLIKLYDEVDIEKEYKNRIKVKIK